MGFSRVVPDFSLETGRRPEAQLFRFGGSPPLPPPLPPPRAPQLDAMSDDDKEVVRARARKGVYVYI